MTKKELNELTYEVIGAAIEVHKALGQGLLESVYYTCMKHELLLRSIPFISEVIVPVLYKGIYVEAELRCDFCSQGFFGSRIKGSGNSSPNP